MNGSSATGNCSDITTGIGNELRLSRCGAPTSSVLFDGKIPTLTGLDGDTWASQLLTLQTTNGARKEIIFDFTGSNPELRAKRVELMVFNCPDWGIPASTIRLSAAPAISPVQTFTVPTIISCDSLVRICISQNIVLPVIALEFVHPDSTWTHLAEVTFYGSGSCIPDTIITTPPPPAMATITCTSSHNTTGSKQACSYASSMHNGGGGGGGGGDGCQVKFLYFCIFLQCKPAKRGESMQLCICL